MVAAGGLVAPALFRRLPAEHRLRARPASYFILGKPLAYIAPQLPSQSRFYLLADIAVPIVPGGIFDQRIRAGLKAPLPGGVRELHMRGEPDRSALLDRYALTIDRSRPCVTIEGARPGTVLESCPLIARTAHQSAIR